MNAVQYTSHNMQYTLHLVFGYAIEIYMFLKSGYRRCHTGVLFFPFAIHKLNPQSVMRYFSFNI